MELLMSQKLPGMGLWGWLGRQLGYVTKAVKADVTQEVVHREQRVQEATLPPRPDMTLRRTTIDEVIIQKRLESQPSRPETRDPEPETRA
jgi:hypothetical protein